MTSVKTEPKPWLSGFCNPSNPPDSHVRCPGGHQANPKREYRRCRCSCHLRLDPQTTATATTGRPLLWDGDQA